MFSCDIECILWGQFEPNKGYELFENIDQDEESERKYENDNGDDVECGWNNITKNKSDLDRLEEKLHKLNKI